MCRIDVIAVGSKLSGLDLSYFGEPFYRGTERERVEPAGLRLATARALSNAIGAKLTLANSPAEDEGLVATIEFPWAYSHD